MQAATLWSDGVLLKAVLLSDVGRVTHEKGSVPLYFLEIFLCGKEGESGAIYLIQLRPSQPSILF